MAGESTKTFFSYARADSEFVLRLVKDLRDAGADVWLDQLDIGPGKHWDTEIEKALLQCPRSLIVLSPASVNSPNVMDEVSYALEQNKEVIPVLYQNCTIPFRLRRLQWVDFRKEYAVALRELLRALASETAIPTPPSSVGLQSAESSVSIAAQPARTAQPVPQSRTPVPMQSSGPSAEVIQERTAMEPPKQEADAVHRSSSGTQPAPVRKKTWFATGAAAILVLILVLWRFVPFHSSGGNADTAQPASPSPSPTQGNGSSKVQPTVSPTPPRKSADGQAHPTPSPIPAPPLINAEAEKYFGNGLRLYKEQQYDDAIAALSRAIDLRANYVDAYVGRGNVYGQIGDYPRAIQDYSQALKINPNNGIVYQHRGDMYRITKSYGPAIQDYAQALKFQPNDINIYLHRGEAYYDSGDYAHAVQDYTQAVGMTYNPETLSLIYNYRGSVYEKQGQSTQAMHDYVKALNLNPSNLSARQNRDRLMSAIRK